MEQKLLTRSLIAAGVVSLALGGYAGVHDPFIAEAAAATAPASAASVAAPSGASAALPNFADIAAANGPAVVNVTVVAKAEGSEVVESMPKIDPNNPFFEFFRKFNFQIPRGGVPARGTGSGFIVSPDGVILTNAHVIGDATDVSVKLTDRREFKAKVIGIDQPSDVAVLKIPATNLPTVTLDLADDVKVGQWVLAIGSPFGFENSVTSGIVSAKYRSFGEKSYVPFIQTDVAVNPGNSGGPLINAKGQVVGINSQIYSQTGGYQGLSFAIPISVALHVKDQLMQHGRVTRGRLGVTIQDVNQALADSFGLKSPTGALVSSVEKDGPAGKAGLEPGDVILRFKGNVVTRSGQLPMLVADTAPGTTVRLELTRNGKNRQVDITVGELEGGKVSVASAGAQEHGRLGVVARPLNKEEKEESGVSGGLIVESVTGPAATAGIQPGDVILSLNDTPVRSPRQLQQLVAKADKHVALLVQRNDAKTFVPVNLG